MIEFSTGSRFEISYYGCFFRIPKGEKDVVYFLVEEEYRPSFEEFVRKTMDKKILPFRKSGRSNG